VIKLKIELYTIDIIVTTIKYIFVVNKMSTADNLRAIMDCCGALITVLDSFEGNDQNTLLDLRDTATIHNIDSHGQSLRALAALVPGTPQAANVNLSLTEIGIP
jgi:hypothetical protein